MDAVDRYRQKRIERMERRYGKFHEARFDDDEETKNQNGNKNVGGNKGGGHGNTRIPFGLCQREGITVQSGWSPKDAWDALAGKGYSASEVYRQLKATGKVGGGGVKSGSDKPKRPPTKIEKKHFPAAMVSKTMEKNTMEAVEYINSHCDDGNITEFLSMGASQNGKFPSVIKCKRSTTGEGCCVYSTVSRTTGAPVETQISIPMFSKAGNDEEKAQAIRSFCHEWTHFIDMIARDEEELGHLSEHNEELKKAIDKETEIKISDEVKKLFDEYNKRYDEHKKIFDAEYSQIQKKLAKKKFGDSFPEWMNEDGSINYYYRGYWTHRTEVSKFTKDLKKEQKAAVTEYKRKNRSMMNGLVSLQGIYDSIYGGRCRDQGIVKYGHSIRYFGSNPGNRLSEALADYVALKATNPSLAEMFRKDKPEMANALDNTIQEITKKLRGV